MTAELDALLLAIPLALRPETSRFSPEVFVHQNGPAPPDYLQALLAIRAVLGK
jgi:hypothetical protein